MYEGNKAHPPQESFKYECIPLFVYFLRESITAFDKNNLLTSADRLEVNGVEWNRKLDRDRNFSFYAVIC